MNSLFAAAAIAVGFILPASAATGTLDTGALVPQTTESRQAAERQNTGAAAQVGHEAHQTPVQAAESAPREAGGIPSKTGRARPGE